MNKIWSAIGAIVGALLLVYVGVSAFTDPSQPPPGGNVPAPLNVGPTHQTKAGDLELGSLKVRGGIDLGGVFRDSWPAGSVACTWEGTKCSCYSDASTFTEVRLTIGTTCRGGKITDSRIMNLDVSSRKKQCWSTPPAGCTPGLYSYVIKN